MSTIIEQYENDNYRLTVKQAAYVDNTLNYQDLFTVVGKHRRYSIGNRDTGNQALLDYIAEDLEISLYMEDEDKEYEYGLKKLDEQLLKDIKEKAFITPLYMYDHSSVAIYTSPTYSDYRSYDQSFVGFAYISKEYACKYYETKDMDKLALKVGNFLEDLLKEYTYYLNGDVYEYTLESKDYCPHCEQIIYKDMDTYSYFYTLNHLDNGIVQSISQTVPLNSVTDLLEHQIA